MSSNLATMKVGYFPGCSLQGSSRDFAESLHAVAKALSIELCEVPEWNCCGASSGHMIEHLVSVALPINVLLKAQKAGLEWSEDLSLPEFYEIYAQSVHRLGTPVFPRELFTYLRSEFPKQVRLFAVRKGKTAIAGVLCFYFQDQVLPYYAGALAEYYKDAPNNFMYWSLMEQSCKEGLRQFDFGRSKRGTGSFDFKSAWSMTATELPYQYHLARANEVPHLSPVDKKFQLPVAAWKRMPFSWTKVIGPRVIRWVPSI